jgi:hypothetical protein
MDVTDNNVLLDEGHEENSSSNESVGSDYLTQ